MMDFTNCKRIFTKAYNGANGKKIAIEYNGKRYMLKFPPSGKNKPTDLSYTNSCFSEHIGSTIFNLVGIKAQNTMLGNFDRHNGNWGFLYHNASDESEIAPVFDCGSCLLPQADEKIMEKILNDEDELNARIYRFPTSAVQYKGKKINYYDFLSSLVDENCISALVRMIPRINVEKINSFIDDEEYLSETAKKFYKYYIYQRYEKILMTVYKKLVTQME